MIYIMIALFAYLIWSLLDDPIDKCKKPDCDNCPFPKCKGCDK